MLGRRRSRNPKKPPLTERPLRPHLLSYARRQVRLGERAGTRSIYPYSLQRALPTTGLSLTRLPHPSFDSFTSTTPTRHAELGATAHDNQIAPTDTVLQSSHEHQLFYGNCSNTTAAATSFGDIPGYDSQDPSIFASQVTNQDEFNLDISDQLPGPGLDTSWTDLCPSSTLPIQENLNYRSSQDYHNLYNPFDMTQDELGQHIQHIQHMRRGVGQAALPPAPSMTSESERFHVRATYENRYQSREVVQFNDMLSLSFCSPAFISNLRETSRVPIDFIPAPPIHRSTLTPDGVVAPIEFFIWVYIEYESPLYPFPPAWIRLFIYRGTGMADDTKITLGRDYSDLLEKQAIT